MTEDFHGQRVKVDNWGEVLSALSGILEVKITDGLDVLLIDANGNLGGTKTFKTVTGTVSVDTDIVAAVAGRRIKVFAYALFSGSTTLNTITFQSNAAGGLWTVPLQAPAANSIFGANLATPGPLPLFATDAGKKLTLDVSAAVNVTYSIAYWDDDPT